MPPTSQAWAWVVVSAVVVAGAVTHSHENTETSAGGVRDTSLSSTPTAVWDLGEDVCGDGTPTAASSRLPPRVEVTWERNASQVTVTCPSKILSLFPFHQSPPVQDPSPPPSSSPSTPSLVTQGSGGVLVNLTHLVQEGRGGQIEVDVEECGCVRVLPGIPSWAEGLTFAIRGSLRLPYGWWVGGGDLREMWVRVNGGVGAGGVCEHLPPTLETLDLSFTPLGSLILEEGCAPPQLQRLEAIQSGLRRVSLCTPTLDTLYLNNNEVGGGMEWAACAGGLRGVLYLHANNNMLTNASTCLSPSLATLELRGNLLTHLDVTSCPPVNLTNLIAARNYLSAAPTPIPPALAYLDVSHNNISEVPALTHSIRKADFSFNQIRALGKATFRRARRLLLLNLGHNQLTHIREKDLNGLKKIHRLDLSHNLLEFVAPSSLLHLHHLRHLHLQHNRLTLIDARDLDALTPHAHATLYSNPWMCNCQMLAALTQLQNCPECKHKKVALQCKERETWQDASSLLRTCLHAIQETQRIQDESDEDYSEEMDDPVEEAGTGAVLIVPSVVVLLLIGVAVAVGYRVYRKHRRAIASTLAPLCGLCGFCRACGYCCAPSAMDNNNHHPPTQLADDDQDSDTETEM